MRSHLTRHVFRRILSSEPLITHRPLHTSCRPRIFSRHGRIITNPATTRPFFNIFKKPSRDIRDPLLDPGMTKMLELDKRLNLIARLPPADELLKAYQQFVQSKDKRDTVIQDSHAVHLLQTLEALEQYRLEGKTPVLSEADLLLTQKVLLRKSEKTDIHKKLAKAVYTAIRARQASGDAERDASNDLVALQNHITLLCAAQSTSEAREALEEAMPKLPSANEALTLWRTVLIGFTRQDEDLEITKTRERMKELDLKPVRSPQLACEQVIQAAKKNTFQQFQTHFRPWMLEQPENPQEADYSPQEMLRMLLEICLRNDEMAWAQKVLEEKFSEFSDQDSWGAILQAAAATGKGVDDIDRMIMVLVRRAEEQSKGETRPAIATFNSLIQFAIDRSDPYRAERYFHLAEKWDVEPNAHTFILQIQYRIMAADLEGAKASYAELRACEDAEDNDADWAIMNSLTQALADARDPEHHKDLMTLVDDLSARRKLFHPATVRALLLHHLARDEYYEAVDLLQTYAPQFSTAVRTSLREVLSSVTLDSKTDTGRAWDAYMIFHQVFDAETPRALRNRVMRRFYEHDRRPDLGTHVFTRMARHMRADTRPDLSSYVAALEGISRTGEPEALEVVHNLLKLDVDVEPCTVLHNALMLGYNSIGREDRALEFWRAIVLSDEGPSYNSLFIAFRACQGQPDGDQVAVQIWRKLVGSDVEIGRELFHSYLAALAGQMRFAEAVELIGEMEKYVGEGEGADLSTMATFFNAGEGVTFQQHIEDWITEHYPHYWKELEEKGMKENEAGFRKVPGFDRQFRA